jgi:hypothetical protein
MEDIKDPVLEAHLKELKSSDSKMRVKGAKALGALNARGAGASPALCRTMLDPVDRVCHAANEALCKVNPQLHKLILPIFTNVNSRVRLDCIRQIGELGLVEGKPALPVLLAYRKKYDTGGSIVVEAIARISRDDKEMTRTFVAWLPSEANAQTRATIAKMIPSMEGSKQYIKPLTIRLEVETNADAKVGLLWALGEFGPDAREARKVVEPLTKNSNPSISEAAKKTLERITAQEAVSGTP